MSAPKHTAGPWEVRFRFGRQTTVSGRQRYPICDTGTAPVVEANHGREEANARLIAAAPDLLEALQWLVATTEDPDAAHQGRALDEARAAIAKATGEGQ